MNDFRNKNETIKDAEARRHAAHHPSPCPLPLRGEGSETVSKRPDDQHLGILYENDAWLGDLFDELARRSIPYTAIRMDDAALMLDQPPAYPVVFNRVSPSSYLRGHGPAIPYARSMLELLSAEGRRVINGAVSFSLETSKFAQLLLFKRLGVRAPRSILFNNRKQIAMLASDFPFPAILKPNCGGSGALIRLIESYEHLVSLLEGDLNLFGDTKRGRERFGKHGEFVADRIGYDVQVFLGKGDKLREGAIPPLDTEHGAVRAMVGQLHLAGRASMARAVNLPHNALALQKAIFAFFDHAHKLMAHDGAHIYPRLATVVDM